ncbi:hypothetical protein IQ238_25115 [Pleurocapsales cyanobacterium LEGE 06147]|nr:hypothetical protein [Pleurocapsales cyanobacterium LEGE 06147]
MKIGTLVRVIYTEYAAHLIGVIQAEENKRRWIVRLEVNPFEDDNKPVLLSLTESDFEAIDSSQKNLGNRFEIILVLKA